MPKSPQTEPTDIETLAHRGSPSRSSSIPPSVSSVLCCRSGTGKAGIGISALELVPRRARDRPHGVCVKAGELLPAVLAGTLML